MSQTRVISPSGRTIGGPKIGGTKPAPPTPEEPVPTPPRRRRGLLVAAVLVVVAVVAGYLFLRGSSETPPKVEEPEPGMTVAVEPRNINLADGRYLRMGFAIQLSAEAEEIPTARATDIAIALYSGRGIDEVNDPERRAALQGELTERLVGAYGEEVLAVYLTEFVTQ